MKMSTLGWMAVIVGIPTCIIFILADIILLASSLMMDWTWK